MEAKDRSKVLHIHDSQLKQSLYCFPPVAFHPLPHLGEGSFLPPTVVLAAVHPHPLFRWGKKVEILVQTQLFLSPRGLRISSAHGRSADTVGAESVPASERACPSTLLGSVWVSTIAQE